MGEVGNDLAVEFDQSCWRPSEFSLANFRWSRTGQEWFHLGPVGLTAEGTPQKSAYAVEKSEDGLLYPS